MQLQGSITALVTPFDDSGELDLEAFRRLLDRQIEAGTQGVVVAGSTGEAAAFEADEFESLLRCAVTRAGDRVLILAGTGSSSTQRTILQTQIAADVGAAMALVVTPPYVRPTQAGLLAHYAAVAERGGLPIVLYNVPARTGVDLLPETVRRLREVPGIVGLKEAVADATRIQDVLALRCAGFAVLSGDDATATQAMLDGADGVISVASNLVPRHFRRLCDAARAGDADVARASDAALQQLYSLLGIEPNPIPVKAALATMGLCSDMMRLPLLPLSAEHRPALAQQIPILAALESAAASG